MSTTPSEVAGYQVGGSISADTAVYVERDADAQLYAALTAGQLCYVFNSRQMGKSSLLIHAKSRLQRDGLRCCFVDLSRISSANLTNEQWFAGIVAELWRGFGLPGGQAMLEWWRTLGNISPAQKFGRFFDHRLLEAYPDDKLVVFFDEVDSVLILPFPSHELFSVVRSLYNQRADEPQLAALRFAFFGVALPSDLVSDKKLSPFNIGQAIALEGFSLEEAAPLAAGMDVPGMCPQALLAAVIQWSNGQPFLTQKLCQLIVRQGRNVPAINEQLWVDRLVEVNVIQDWESTDNPEHLRTIRDRVLLDDNASIVNLAGYAQLLAADHEEMPADALDDVDRLYLTGLIALNNGLVRPRTKVYRRVFNRSWLEEQLNARRPYAPGLRAWLEDGSEQWLLRGEELEAAKSWSDGKHLPEVDHQYLSASRELESRAYRDWNKRLQDEIAQRKAVERELEQAKSEAELANRAKSDFLARVSHEVRTPINSIMGLSHLALQQDMGDISQDYLNRIGRTARYMLGIVNDIVDIGKIERGELDLVMETFHLDEVMDRLIDVLTPRLIEKGLELDLHFSRVDAPAVVGDAVRLEQLLLNLCTNAIKHSDGGTLQLKLEFAEPLAGSMGVHFSVQDNGKGIARTPVSGVVSTDETSVLVPGLGLSLCCHLVELMGGDIWVNSEPGIGSCFRAQLTFPIAPTLEESASTGSNIAFLAPESMPALHDTIQRLGFATSVASLGKPESAPDVLVFDGNDSSLQATLSIIRRANPETTLLPVLPPAQPLPDRLLALDILKILDYPASPRRILESLLQHGPEEAAENSLTPLFKAGTKVLVAEDDEISQMVVKELLEQAGLDVVLTDNGAQALEYLSRSAFDLLLMDIEMPIMNGLEAIAELRQQSRVDSRLEELPVIAMTAHALVGDRERFLAAGMNDHITKPLDPADLWRKLAEWLPLAGQTRADSEPSRILVVDDQPDSIRVLMEILQPVYTVIVANSGARALQLLQEQTPPDAILLDVQMPEMDGFEVFRALKENPETAAIPVIFISGSEQDEEFRRGIDLGAFDFVAKPVSGSLLRHRLERCLASSS